MHAQTAARLNDYMGQSHAE